MAYRDLRDWINRLEQEKQLKRITAKVHWDEEIGGICRAVLDMKEEGPALLFENIVDYEDGHCTKLFTNSMGNYARTALMTGLPVNAPVKDQIIALREMNRSLVKPVLVESGPVKENIELGEDANLLEFPVPKWHRHDGGRYIITFAGVVTKDPETGWVNVGVYRGMIVHGRGIACNLLYGKHWGQHFHKYKLMGKPMPVAVVFGYDPVLPFVACAPYPAGVNEYEVMGALRGEPVELVKCETVDLEVPATAEIVVEGFISPDSEACIQEGPFGEFTGYYGGFSKPRPVIEVSAITHRNDPILQGMLEGDPITEDHRCASIAMSAIAWDGLERNGVPGVMDVFSPPLGCGTNIRVQINKRYQGHAKQVAASLWGTNLITAWKNVIVVDDDINIHDPDDVEWAFSFRVNAKEDDIVVYPGSTGSPLDPSTFPEWNDPVRLGGGRWNRMLIDATKDWRWGPREEWRGERFAPRCRPSDEEMALIRERWSEYGF